MKNVPSEVREFLEELAWKIELKESVQRPSKTLEKVPPADKGFSTRSVREDPESN